LASSSTVARAQSPDSRLAALGIVLPPPPAAIANYVPFRRAGKLLFIAGQIAMREGQALHPGSVPDKVSIDQAREAARQCALQVLSIAKGAAGSLGQIKQILRVDGFVLSAPGFSDQPRIMDAASDLFVEILGERGRHARVSVGAAGLPRNACVEIAVTLELNRAA
jgi:enamine deaminase RidA (YjgF/YER057c/UK114 family)